MRISRTQLGLALTGLLALSGACTPTVEKPLLAATEVLPTAAEATPMAFPTQTPALLPTTQASARLALAYYTGTPASFAALTAQAAEVDIVSVDVYSVQMDGSLAGADPYDAAAFARAHGMLAYACVSNWNSDPAVTDFDSALAEAALVTHKEAVIAALVELARSGGYAGVNIDFENIAYSADVEESRAALTGFIQELALELHAQGLGLIISVPGATGDDLYNTWAYPFDLAALGQAADYLQMMTYDQHGPWGEPGPVAGLDWVAACLDFATQQVDPARLLIGIPAYGYDWDLTGGQTDSFSWTETPARLSLPGAVQAWEAAAQSPSLSYTLEGNAHVAWFENAASLQAKRALVEQYGLAGLSVWSLGQEDGAFWQALTGQ